MASASVTPLKESTQVGGRPFPYLFKPTAETGFGTIYSNVIDMCFGKCAFNLGFYKYCKYVTGMTWSNMWNHTSKLFSNWRWRMVRFYSVDGIWSQQKVKYFRIYNCDIIMHSLLPFSPLVLTPILNVCIRLRGSFRRPWAHWVSVCGRCCSSQ